MGASVNLRPARIHVAPGGEAVIEAVIRNTGTIVDQFTVSVVGGVESWADINPGTLRLFPAAEETVRISLRPPKSSQVQAGELPFGVRVASSEDPQGSSVEEGVLDVGNYFDVGADLIPAASQGRKRGKHDLAIDNRGNSRLPVSIDAFDEANFLRFELDPAYVDTAPGTAGFSKVRVKAPKGFWLGPVKTHPFQLSVSSDGQIEPRQVVGTFLQKPRIPRWLPRAVLALLALAVLGALAWFFLLKPTVESAAQDALEDPLAAQDTKIAAQGQQLAQQGKAIEDLTGSPLPPPPSPAPTAEEGLGEAFDGRLFTSRTTAQGPGGNSTANSYLVPAGSTLSITDFVLGSPDANGDSGTVTILRGTKPLLQLRLENFRDIDYHFVSPIRFKENERLRLSVTCENAGSEASDPCNVTLYFSGFLKS